MSYRYGLVVLVALGLALPALAQESASVIAAKQHLRALAPASALAGDDLADLRAIDSYPDRRTGQHQRHPEFVQRLFDHLERANGAIEQGTGAVDPPAG